MQTFFLINVVYISFLINMALFFSASQTMHHTHLDFDYQGVDGGVQLPDLFAHLLLALLEPAHHLVEAVHPLLQVTHLD